jgi:hypothetical protein
MYRKGKKGVIEIIKSLKKLNSIEPLIFWKLFDTQIEPILTYAAEVWGIVDNNQMENVHTFAIKLFLNVPLHSSNRMVYGETGRYPLYIRAYLKCVKYWLKLLKLPSTRLCRQAYLMLVQQHENGKYNWVSHVKKMLTENGFGIVWLSQEVGDDSMFLLELKDRLICIFKQDRHAHMEDNEKYTWFLSFNSNLQPEKYLSVVTHRWYRSMLARFRTRTLGLNANKNWFVSGAAENICPACKLNTIEDEFHFLFQCKAYETIRQKCNIFQAPIIRRQNLVDVLTLENEELIRSLARYVAEACQVRIHSTNV